MQFRRDTEVVILDIAKKILIEIFVATMGTNQLTRAPRGDATQPS